MNKLFAIGLAFMWSTGATTGYFIAKWDLQSNAPQAIAQPENPQLKTADIREFKGKTPRQLLEDKYRLCDGAGDISRVPDDVLRQSISKICIKKS